jgi:hypothetical protein
MEAERFDRLIKSVGQATDRRSLLAALLGGCLTALRERGAAAKPKDKPPKDKPPKDKCTGVGCCPPGGCPEPDAGCQMCQDGACVTDPALEGVSCGSELCHVCQGGRCVAAGEQEFCGDCGVCQAGACVPASAQECGMCRLCVDGFCTEAEDGVDCPTAAGGAGTCCNGSCEEPCTNGCLANPDEGCLCTRPPAGLTYCPLSATQSDKCVNLQTDPTNCGSCGTACNPVACSGGQCVTCDEPGALCGIPGHFGCCPSGYSCAGALGGNLTCCKVPITGDCVCVADSIPCDEFGNCCIPF